MEARKSFVCRTGNAYIARIHSVENVQILVLSLRALSSFADCVSNIKVFLLPGVRTDACIDV